MEKNKTSKKTLKNLINTSIAESLGKLELPTPSKKAKKLIGKSAKKLAEIFSDAIKREQKKKEKSAKALTVTVDVPKKKSKKKSTLA